MHTLLSLLLGVIGTAYAASLDLTISVAAEPPPSNAPTVSAITPNTGPAGILVTITGSGFFVGTNGPLVSSVNFSGVEALNVNIPSDTKITATTPAHADGAVDVQVRTTGGTSAPNTLFTYAAASGGGGNGGNETSNSHCASPVDGVYCLKADGNDSNDGRTYATAWSTPNHVLPCGSIVYMKTGTMSGNLFRKFAQPSNCANNDAGPNFVAYLATAFISASARPTPRTALASRLRRAKTG